MRKAIIILILISNCVYAQFSDSDYLKMGKAKLETGKHFEAVDLLTKAIESNPDNDQAWMLRGESFHELGEYKRAVSDYDHIIKRKKIIDESSSIYYLKRGIAKTEYRDFEGAVQDLNMAIELKPLSDQAYFARSRLKFLTLKDKNEAIKDIDVSIRINSDNPDYFVTRAEYKAHMGKYGFDEGPMLESAVRDLSFAIYLKPDDYDLYKQRSRYNKERGDPLAAVEDYNRMIELRPDIDEAYSNRGIIKMQYDDYESAIDDFTHSIELKPLKENSYRFRGLCRHNQLDYRGAYKDYSYSIKLLYGEYEISKDKIQIQRLLADTYIKRGAAAISLGNTFNACADFKRAYELGSKRGLNYIRKYCGL